MMLPSRLDCPLSLKTPNMGNPGQDQLGGLFSQIEGDPPPSSDVETLASRLVGIDFGQLANAIESPVGPKDPVTGIPQTPHKLVLNLFADVVLTGIVEHVEPTASGHALWGGLEGVKLGTMTLVVNGSVVVGTVRTPDAVYTIRTAGGGAYVVRQIDESSLPPLGEPLRGSIPEPDSPPPVRRKYEARTLRTARQRQPRLPPPCRLWRRHPRNRLPMKPWQAACSRGRGRSAAQHRR